MVTVSWLNENGLGSTGVPLMDIFGRIKTCTAIASYVSHGQYSPKMVDGHPIHNKDPKIMVIINPYEPLDD